MSTAFLQERGLQADQHELQDLIEEALRQLPRGPHSNDASAELTLAELAVLDRGGLRTGPVELGSDDPLSRTTATWVALLATSLTAREVAERLGLTEGRIRQLLADGRLYGVKKGAAWRIPAFQLSGEGLVPNWEPVMAAIDPRIHPVALYRWATEPSPDLVVDERPVSPIDWLTSGGDPAAVIDQARHL